MRLHVHVGRAGAPLRKSCARPLCAMQCMAPVHEARRSHDAVAARATHAALATHAYSTCRKGTVVGTRGRRQFGRLWRFGPLGLEPPGTGCVHATCAFNVRGGGACAAPCCGAHLSEGKLATADGQQGRWRTQGGRVLASTKALRLVSELLLSKCAPPANAMTANAAHMT
jgi:hypothetical protein